MKRLIVCSDGTWNVRDQQDKTTGKRRPTNVTKVARAVLPRSTKGVEQVVFYDEGIGTSGGFEKLTGGAFGVGIDKNICDLYRNIVYNYADGDEIFLFGFSRGAFTVRSLAGFMQLVGLVDKDADYWVPEVFACYHRGERPGAPKWDELFRRIGTDRRPCPPITFVGVWDTVGALGPPGFLGQIFGRRKYAFHEVGLTPSIEHAYHALAIDERRKPFSPSVFKRPPDWQGTLEQAWFPGAHADIGGGETPDGLANEALHWMVEKAEQHGLEVDNAYLAHFRDCFNGTFHESMSGAYRVLGEYRRPIGTEGNDERLHRAAVDRHLLLACNYRPPNLMAYFAQHQGAPAYQTTRVPSGEPCP